ncbi:unnamed protein product [Colias eurytheme]|nr:unnamed protein product [Colias eurytheme]
MNWNILVSLRCSGRGDELCGLSRSHPPPPAPCRASALPARALYALYTLFFSLQSEASPPGGELGKALTLPSADTANFAVLYGANQNSTQLTKLSVKAIS